MSHLLKGNILLYFYLSKVLFILIYASCQTNIVKNLRIYMIAYPPILPKPTEHIFIFPMPSNMMS